MMIMVQNAIQPKTGTISFLVTQHIRENQSVQHLNASTVLSTNMHAYMWLSLRKPSLTAYLVFQEIPFWNIEATAVLLCCVLVMLDLQYN